MPSRARRSTPAAPAAPVLDTDPRTRRVRSLAYLLDNSIPLPGGFRVGLDALIGLIPGVGDVAGSVLSAYILAEGARMGVPRSVLLRMAGNVGIETVVGAIPFLGDLFDAGWKANARNARLLTEHLEQPTQTERASRGLVVLVFLGLLLLLVGAGAFTVLLVRGLMERL